MTDQVDSTRRDFLRDSAAAFGTIAFAPAVLLSSESHAKPLDEAVSDSTRWGLLVDTKACVGCGDCVDACNKEHGIKAKHGPETDAQWIRTVRIRRVDTGHVKTLPMMCQHCEHPPCVDVCPTGASFRRIDGVVLVDKHRCIGCRYCMMACPYKARSFIHEDLTDQYEIAPRGKGTVESCTLCVHRIDDPSRDKSDPALTACAEACDAGAIIFGDLKDPKSEIAKRLAEQGATEIRSDLGLNTGVRYQGL